VDPLDREKPWRPFGQLLLITLVIGLIYLVFRVAVVIPERGWQLIAAATLVGVILYYLLAFRWARAARGATPKPTAGRSAWRTLLAALLILGLTLPLWVVLYFVWFGGQLWK
jgi:multisubunit Na+/H+ antiporter MnhB subunit